MKRITALFLIILFPLYLSCSSNSQESLSNNPNNNQENEDPQTINRIIPPDSSLTIDFTTLEETNKLYSAKQRCGQIDPDEFACLAKAMALVWWGNSICFWSLAIPVAIYQMLKSQIPAEISTDHVIWNYTYTHGDDVYNVTVTADFVAATQEWKWSFKINDFTWITGASKDDVTAGNWQFYDPTGNKTIGVEWTRTSDINGTVQFTNNNESQTLKYGDFIRYARNGNDISVTFHDVHCWIPEPAPSGTDDGAGLLEMIVYWNISDKTGGIDVTQDSTGSHSDCSWNPISE